MSQRSFLRAVDATGSKTTTSLGNVEVALLDEARWTMSVTMRAAQLEQRVHLMLLLWLA